MNKICDLIPAVMQGELSQVSLSSVQPDSGRPSSQFLDNMHKYPDSIKKEHKHKLCIF